MIKPKYLRANPNSELGRNFTDAHNKGWILVCINEKGFPIFKESFTRWFKRVIMKKMDHIVPS